MGGVGVVNERLRASGCNLQRHPGTYATRVSCPSSLAATRYTQALTYGIAKHAAKLRYLIKFDLSSGVEVVKALGIASTSIGFQGICKGLHTTRGRYIYLNNGLTIHQQLPWLSRAKQDINHTTLTTPRGCMGSILAVGFY